MEDPKNWWLGRIRDFAIFVGGGALFVGLCMLFDISPGDVLFYVLGLGFIIAIRPLIMR